METIDTSSKLSFSLNWRPKVASDESEMDTKELVSILKIMMGLFVSSKR